MHDFAELCDLREDAALALREIGGAAGENVLFSEPCADRAHPALENKRESPALRHRLRGEVLHELLIGREPLPLRPLKAAFGREIGVGHHEPAVHRIGPYRLEEKALAAPVAAGNEAHRGAPFAHDLDVGQKRIDFLLAAYGNVGESDARHNAALEGIQYRAGNAFRNFLLLSHVFFGMLIFTAE